MAIPRPSVPRRLTPRPFVLVGGLGLLLGVVATIHAAYGITDPRRDTDLLVYFLPAAGNVSLAHPFAIYEVRFGIFPNTNPPLAIMLMAGLLDLARAVHLPGVQACADSGYLDLACRPLVALVSLAFVPFVAGIGGLAVVAIRRAQPRLPATRLLAAFTLLVLSPLIWQDFIRWWHLEQVLMLCFLLGAVVTLQARQPILAGVLLGFAILTRTTAIVPILAILVVVALTDRPRLVRLALPLALVAGIGILPFLAADPQNAFYSLLTWRGDAPIGVSVWSLLGGTALEPVAMRIDEPLILVGTIIIAILGVRRFGVSSSDRGLWGLLAAVMLLVPLLSKSTWPYYYAEPFVPLVVWEAATALDAPPGLWRWPLLSVVFLAAGSTAATFLFSHSFGGLDVRMLGVTEFLWIGGVLLAVVDRLGATVPRRSATPPPPVVSGAA